MVYSNLLRIRLIALSIRCINWEFVSIFNLSTGVPSGESRNDLALQSIGKVMKSLFQTQGFGNLSAEWPPVARSPSQNFLRHAYGPTFTFQWDVHYSFKTKNSIIQGIFIFSFNRNYFCPERVFGLIRPPSENHCICRKTLQYIR